MNETDASLEMFMEYALPSEVSPFGQPWTERAPFPWNDWVEKKRRRLRFHRALEKQIALHKWDQFHLLGQWSTTIEGRPALIGEGAHASSAGWGSVCNEAIEQLLHLFATHLALQINWEDLIPCSDGTIAIRVSDGGRDTRGRLVEHLVAVRGPKVYERWRQIEEESGLLAARKEIADGVQRKLAYLFLREDHPIYATLERLVQEEGLLLGESDGSPDLTYTHPDLPGWKLQRPAHSESGSRYQLLITPHHTFRGHVTQLGLGQIELGEGWLYRLPDDQLALVLEEPEGRPLTELPQETMEEVALLSAWIRTLIISSTTCRLLSSGKLWIGPLAFASNHLQSFTDNLFPWISPASRRVALAIFTKELTRMEQAQPPIEIKPEIAQLLHDSKRFLLPKEHPLYDRLEHLIVDPTEFIDRGTLTRAGYSIAREDEGRSQTQIMVATHKDLPGVVLKTFPLLGDHEPHYARRLNNYMGRIRSAERVRECIEREGCRHLVLPKKWLYRLPDNFSNPATPHGKYLLIAEKIDLLNEQEREELYNKLTEEEVDELIRVILKSDIGDIQPHNLPLTRDGKIAFIDTERRPPGAERYVEEILSFISPSLFPFAKRRWKEVQLEIERSQSLT